MGKRQLSISNSISQWSSAFKIPLIHALDQLTLNTRPAYDLSGFKITAKEWDSLFKLYIPKVPIMWYAFRIYKKIFRQLNDTFHLTIEKKTVGEYLSSSYSDNRHIYLQSLYDTPALY